MQQQQLPLLLQQQQQHQQQQQQQQLQLQQQQQQQKTEPRLKARSPKELYKNDFLDKLMAKGESVNVATRKFWDDFRQAWENLDDERKQIYENLAAMENAVAKHNRKVSESKAKAKAEAKATARQPLSSSATAPSPAPALALPAPSPAHQQGDGGAKAQVYTPTHGSACAVVLLVATSEPSPDALAQIGALRSSSRSALPMSASILESCLQQNTLNEIKTAFISKANQVWQTPDLEIPEVVDYGEACRGLCNSKTPRVPHAMMQLLWQQWAKRFTPYSENILLVCEVYRADHRDPSKFGFCVLTSASCQYGRHPARQDFLLLDVLHKPAAESYEGCVLTAGRKAFHKPHPSMPRNFAKFFLGARGELHIITEDRGGIL